MSGVNKTYTLSFCCRNCGHGFDREVPYGVEVEDSDDGAYIDGEGGYIICPNCGSTKTEKRFKKL